VNGEIIAISDDSSCNLKGNSP